MRVHRQERDTLRTIPREVQTVLAVHIAPVDGVAVLVFAPGIVTTPSRAQLMLPQPVERLFAGEHKQHCADERPSRHIPVLALRE